MSDTTLRDLVLKRLEADTRPEDEWSALVERQAILRDLKAQGAVSVTGHGPGARWSRRGTTPKKG
jgi:hypothetical protein